MNLARAMVCARRAIDRSAGNAITLWLDQTNVRASAYLRGKGWQDSQQLNPDDRKIEMATLAVSGDGSGFALWQDAATDDRATWAAVMK